MGTSTHWRSVVGAILGCAVLLRLIYAAQVELLPEEAYYWNYSRHLDIGYLDHPPMVAWLIRLGTTLFGQTEFGVRAGALCCGLIASVFLYRLTRNLFGETSGLMALALAQVLPYFFMSGLLMTPDAPLTACWAAALYFLERALFAGRPGAWVWVGVAFGAGLLSKYTIGLLGLAALVFMVVDPVSRRWLRRPEPYAAALIAATAFSPVILWNSRHEWASFAFQTSRRLAERPRFSLHKLIGAAIVLLTPTGVAAASAALWRTLPQGEYAAEAISLRRRRTFLKVCVLVPIAVFVLFSLRHDVKLDWTGASWVGVIPLLAAGMAEAFATPADAQGSTRVPGRWQRRAWPATVVALLLIYGTGWVYLVIGLPGVGYSAHTELVPVAWRQFGRRMGEIADALRLPSGEKLLIVGMDRYAIASELAFYSSDQTQSVAETSAGHLFGDMGLMYQQWFPPMLQAGRTLLLVAWDAGTLNDARFAGRVARISAIQQGYLVKDGRMVRPYFYRVAYGYRPGGGS